MADSQRTRRLSRSRATRTRGGRTTRVPVSDRADRRPETDPTETGVPAGADRGDAVRKLTGLDIEQSDIYQIEDTAPGDASADGHIAAGNAAARDCGAAAGGSPGPTAAERPAMAAQGDGSESGDADTAAPVGSTQTCDSTGGGAAGDLLVRPARSRRVGRRRAADPVIGDQLATELLGDHRQDVLLSDRCSCGDRFPCRSRAFATCFVLDRSYPPADLEMPYRIVPPELRVQRAPRHAAPVSPAGLGSQAIPSLAVDGTVVSPERAPEGEMRPGFPAGNRPVTSAGTGADLPIDLDSTVQFAKVPAEAPVAVAS